MKRSGKLLVNGDEAVAYAALHCGVKLGTGYPGTPSTEILETFAEIGGQAQWAPNEKVALEVGIGAAFGRARALVTMKHVGVNVAADPLFTAAETDIAGGLVIVACDDPGMASSQNEQDSRHYAKAAGVPMLEPADSQEAYDYTALAFEMSERWHIPVILRLTTRISHSKSIIITRKLGQPQAAPGYERNVRERVMIPAYARPAHQKQVQKLKEIREWSETSSFVQVLDGEAGTGLIASGISAMHAREAMPKTRMLKLGISYPLPLKAIRSFAASVKRCLVIEEGDPILFEACRAAGIPVEGKPEKYIFGELSVERVRRIISGDMSPEPVAAKGKPPQLCPGCPHRAAFETLRKLDCIVSGDIGCYTLGVLAPFESMDTCVCMGASIGIGLGLRHVLPDAQARKVVSVIGDSTFVHSGITGVVEMAYNPPPTGHVVLILDNGTTAMTGLQEHPGTGRQLDGATTNTLDIVALCKSIGIENVVVIDAQQNQAEFETLLQQALASGKLWIIVARKPCILAFKRQREREKALAAKPN